ncbi:Crp/Fnr family transcriptional regulator [Qipengyuania sp. 6B39]|uniref:Crp/Fnr family transcriptional regulator n=1 Tax=Qipengyuania proteolytica TaxID=2867239 RepID=UPI001C88E766|nr:Crp/Fnr family transcriptional regulator [Qipengyuania proteolytica]MBX7497034.1 Crp/Fnr family transcriptional regulator [Qipengyuania proteolytica]
MTACPGLRPLEPRQLAYMEGFKDGETALESGDVLIDQGEQSHRLYTVIEGVLIRYRTLDDGRRQIVSFMFPGDLAGLQGAFDEPASHSVEALTEARLCRFKRHDFVELIATHPRLGYDMTWLAAKEETALEEHIVALGQRSARERVAYLAVWLLDRALATGIAARDNVLHLSIKQSQVADMLGLSLVHTNRTMRQLEREGLVVWKSREICVPDMDAACEVAQFSGQGTSLRPFI